MNKLDALPYNPGQSFIRGVTYTLPALLGVIPYGLVVGVAAVGAGMPEGMAISLSVILFAGSAQLAMCQLIGLGAPWAVVLASAVVLNIRFMMYSAALAPHYAKVPLLRRLLLAYTLTDQGFALVINRYYQDPGRARQGWFMLGSGTLLWVFWVAMTILGVWLGASVPASWSLDFSVWLIFLCLARMSVRGRDTAVAAIVAAVAALFALGLPLKLGLLAATAVGVLAGLLVPVRK